MSGTGERLPLPIWAAIFSTLCMIVGWNWDISWHRSIGRDTVWTPAHIAIYVSLAIALLYNLWLVAAQTLGSLKQIPGIRLLGLSGPAGSFVTLWAILLQTTGLLFDAWWHDVYGLDSAVFSPPHYVLALSYAFFYFGQFMVVAAYRNRAGPSLARKIRWVELMIWSFLLGQQLLGMDPSFGPYAAISRTFIWSCALILPFTLVGFQVYQKWKWASVACASLYMLEIIILMQIFQLFPATPRFGPVYHRIDFFLPPAFPLLLVVPAVALAFLVARTEPAPASEPTPARVPNPGPPEAREEQQPQSSRLGTLRTHLLLGFAFVVTFVGTNFVTMKFLLSKWADNAFFGGGYPASAFLKNVLPVTELEPSVSGGILLILSIGLASLSSWSGLHFGKWLRQVVR